MEEEEEVEGDALLKLECSKDWARTLLEVLTGKDCLDAQAVKKKINGSHLFVFGNV